MVAMVPEAVMPTEEEQRRLAEGWCEPEISAPPSERDEAIYEAIYVQSRSAAAVAREFLLAPTTVRNIALKTQQKLARRQHELRKLGSLEGLSLVYARLEGKLQFVSDLMHAGAEIRTTRTTEEPGDSRKLWPGQTPAEAARPGERVVTTIREDPNVALRQAKVAHQILKDLWALQVQIRQLEREEAQAAEKQQAQSPAGREAEIERQFAEKTLIDRLQRERLGRLQADVRQEHQAAATRPREQAAQERAQAQNRRTEQKALAMHAAGVQEPAPGAPAAEWDAFFTLWNSMDDTWQPLPKPVSDAAEVTPAQEHAAADVAASATHDR